MTDKPKRVIWLGRDGTEYEVTIEGQGVTGLRAEWDELREGIDLAWGLIANASDWDGNPEWREAAERWRDRFMG